MLLARGEKVAARDTRITRLLRRQWEKSPQIHGDLPKFLSIGKYMVSIFLLAWLARVLS